MTGEADTARPAGSRGSRGRRTRRGGPLGVRSVRLLSLGQFTSTLGDYCYAVALPWLVLSAHGGTILLGVVLACYGVPRTALIPAGGLLADRLNPRLVMLAADVARCALVALLAVFAARGLDTLAFLGPVAALLGAGEGLFLPASAAIMPSLVDPETLQAANGVSAAAVQVGSLAGPVLGGLLVTTSGPAPAFAADAATFAVSAASLAMIRRREAHSEAGSPGPGEGQATSTWRLLLRARVLQVLLTLSVLANFVIAGAFDVALPALAHARFGAAGYGAIIACFGAGSVTGMLAAARFSALRRPAQVACLGFLAGAVAVAAVPYAGGLPGACAACVVLGTAAGFGNVILITLLQRWAPARLLGRLMSLVMLASIGAFPVAAALSGLIVRGIGPVPFFPAAGAIFAVVLLMALGQREFRAFGAEADAQPDQAAVVAR